MVTLRPSTVYTRNARSRGRCARSTSHVASGPTFLTAMQKAKCDLLRDCKIKLNLKETSWLCPRRGLNTTPRVNKTSFIVR